eukprot:4438706-Heterocapsa_arctica.AAC.1
MDSKAFLAPGQLGVGLVVQSGTGARRLRKVADATLAACCGIGIHPRCAAAVPCGDAGEDVFHAARRWGVA